MLNEIQNGMRRGFIIAYLLVVISWLFVPINVTSGLQDAGIQNGCGYRMTIPESDWKNVYVQNFVTTKESISENWLHPATKVWHTPIWDGWIHVIKPNGFFAKYQHDVFFNNSLPFDHEQLVVIFAGKFLIVEFAKWGCAEIVRQLKHNFRLFPNTFYSCGYVVNV